MLVYGDFANISIEWTGLDYFSVDINRQEKYIDQHIIAAD